MNSPADMTRPPAPLAEQTPASPCPTGTDEDNDLITQFLSGSESAFDTLVLRHQQRAFSIAYGLLGSHEDAAEVAQDAFVKVWHALAGFRRDASFTTWLFRIVTNLAHNKNRHAVVRGKGRIVPIDGADGESIPLPDSRPSASEEAMAKESEQRLLDALDQLGADHREVVVLYSLQEASYEQIAATLDLSVGTVKSRLFRARQELTRLLRKP